MGIRVQAKSSSPKKKQEYGEDSPRLYPVCHAFFVEGRARSVEEELEKSPWGKFRSIQALGSDVEGKG